MLANIRNLISNQSGDTIVEVLISLAILTFVLAAAFNTASQSYTNVRNSQEHSEALTIAQTQIEEIREITPGSFVASGVNKDNCIQDNGSTISPSTNTCDVENNNQAGSAYQTSCPPAVSYCYNIEVTRSSAFTSGSATSYLYSIVVKWPPVDGGGSYDYVTLYYRWNS